MHIFVRNVNDAFEDLVGVFQAATQYGTSEGGVFASGKHKATCSISRKPSRVGEVLQIEEPVTVTYREPTERVLFNAARDCNPFFHVYETLWMLAGRRDVAPLAYYNSKIAEMVSDDGKYQNGAYGYRWRHWPVSLLHPLQEVDQLHVIAEHLKQVNGSRRAVLQMWDPNRDLCQNLYLKDVPCNVTAFFSIREIKGEEFHLAGVPCRETKQYLDMTVCNRSNDLVWGMLGANVVHFSFLQEYMAAKIGVSVGKYHQFTNNLHVYTERFEAEKWLAEYEPKQMCSKHWKDNIEKVVKYPSFLSED